MRILSILSALAMIALTTVSFGFALTNHNGDGTLWFVVSLVAALHVRATAREGR